MITANVCQRIADRAERARALKALGASLPDDGADQPEQDALVQFPMDGRWQLPPMYCSTPTAADAAAPLAPHAAPTAMVSGIVADDARVYQR